MIRSLLEHLLSNDVDGIEKKVDGWHIDEINESIRKQNKLWYKKSFELYPIVYVLAQQLQITWDMNLDIYLKDRRKKEYLGLNFKNVQELKKELDCYTPLEFYILDRQYPESKKLIFLPENKYEFLPNYIEGYFYQNYHADSRSYSKAFDLYLKNEYLFRLMIARLFKGLKINLNDCTYMHRQDQARIEQLNELLKKDPTNTVFLKELGILLLLSFGDANKSREILKQVVNHDPKNVDAYFWLAISNYYYFSDINSALKLLQDALVVDPNRSDCLSLLYRFSWRLQKSATNSMDYLKRAIDNAPDWILPRVQLIQSLGITNPLGVSKTFELAQKETRELLKVVKKYTIPGNTIDKYYATYVTGKIPDNQLLIKALERKYLSTKLRIQN